MGVRYTIHYLIVKTQTPWCAHPSVTQLCRVHRTCMVVNHLLALPEELLRTSCTYLKTRAGDSLSSLQVAVLRGGLCEQLRQLLYGGQDGEYGADTGKLHGRDAASMFYASRCYESYASCRSRAFVRVCAPLHGRCTTLQLQRLTCLRLQDTMLYPGRYRLLLEQLLILQHIDFIDVHTIDRVELQQRHFCYHLELGGRPPVPDDLLKMPPLRGYVVDSSMCLRDKPWGGGCLRQQPRYLAVEAE